MKLAVSNISWPSEQDEPVAGVLAGLGVGGIEIAPTKIWQAPLEVPGVEVDAYRRSWEDRGIPIVSAQSLLFGQPQLTLFDSPAVRHQTLDYLRGIVELCARLGAGALVFGSPRNRRVGQGDRTAAWQIAIDFFGKLGEIAAASGTVIGMEANPPDYGGDFVVRANEAIQLVRAVNHPGFRLHLDAACMTMAGDSPSIIGEVLPILQHFHVSEPLLAPIGTGAVDHAAFGKTLRQVGYPGWIAIEMRQVDPFNPDTVAAAVRCAKAAYDNPAEI